MTAQQMTDSASAPAEGIASEKIPKAGVLLRLFRIILGLYCIVFVLRFMASYWWFADLFSHFPLQGFLAGLFLIFLGSCVRETKLVVITCLMTCLYGFELLPYFPTVSDQPAPPGAKTLLAWNVYVGNQEKSKLIETVRTTDADYVLLLETDERWNSALAALDDTYPERYTNSEGAFGVTFLSREPVESVRIEDLGEKLINSVVAELPGGVTLYGIHFFPPGGAEYTRIRNQQIDDLMETVGATSGPVLVAGDLNLSPWSPYFSKLTDSGRLLDVRKGRGLINSWPGHTILERTAIDHILPSPQIEIHSLERLPDTCGSDHFGLLFRFSVRE